MFIKLGMIVLIGVLALVTTVYLGIIISILVCRCVVCLINQVFGFGFMPKAS